MLSSGVVAILVVIATTGCVQAKGDYFIVCPNLIRPTEMFECEVSYVGPETSISVTIDLGLPGESTPLVTKTETVNGYKSISFVLNQVPEGTITVTAVGTRMDGTQLFTNNTQIQTEQRNHLSFVQTDKPIYKPGDKVQMRIISTNQDLKPVNEPTDITIIDPKDQKLDQWLAAEGESGVIEWFYQLSDEPILGEWKIKVGSERSRTVKTFNVDEYVLPRFSVKASTDKKTLVTGADTQLKVTVKPMTTYGKFVQGTTTIIIGTGKRRFVTKPVTLTPGDDDSHTITFQLGELENYKNGNSLSLTANVTEASSDVTLSSDPVRVMWYDERIKMEILPTSDSLYRPGLSFTVFLQLTDIVTGKAPAEMMRPVMVSTSFGTSVEKSIDWDNNGLAEAEFMVPANYVESQWSSGLYVSAQMCKSGCESESSRKDYYRASVYVKRYRAKLNTTLNVERINDGAIKAGDAFGVKVTTTGTLTQVAYMVLARGRIVASGIINMPELSKSIVITSTREMSPGAKVFVYGIVSGEKEKELIADSVDIKVTGVFGDNKLTLSFSPTEVRPGKNVDVTLNYTANAKYYILAVDESVLLMMTGNNLEKADVIKRIMGFSAGTTPTYNDGPEPHGKVMGDMIMPGPSPGSNDEPTSAGELLKKEGVVFLSDIFVEEMKKVEPPMFAFGGAEREMAFPAGLIRLSGVYVEKEVPRDDFIMFRGRNDARMMEGNHADHNKNLKAGLIRLSGVYVEKEASRDDFMIMEAMADGEDDFRRKGAEVADDSAESVAPAPEEAFAEVGRTRSDFRETWMWIAGTLNTNGMITFTEKVPDTITDYVASAFAISEEKGLAITEDTTPVRIFQPFFVSVALRYSIVRGESFVLRVSISNYLKDETPVKVTLERSDDFDVVERSADGTETKESKDVVTTVQVKPNKPAGVTFEISPKILGDVKIFLVAAPAASTGEKADRIEKTVLVKPEGFVQRRSESRSLQLTEENPIFNDRISLKNTKEIVTGSRKVKVEVCGDVMGKALGGLGRLVRQPTGCGEQNMITLVPNIFVRKYLDSTDRLTTKIKDDTTKNMKTGYARELTYKLKDGSFSAFGERDVNGSTWLTAFVMKSFSQAKAYISPDPNIMKTSIGWLLDSQSNDGTFPKLGRVIHQEMLGGASGGKALTAYVYIALKESEYFMDTSQVNKLKKTKTYLEGLVMEKSLTGLYEKALTLYALRLADSSYTDQLLQDIESSKHEKPWEKDPVEPKPVPVVEGRPALFDNRRPEPKGTDIETWSYVLLTYAMDGNLADGNKIMKWLVEQQNGGGGFQSTQDTVLALQALAEYARLLYTAPRTDIVVYLTARAQSGDKSHRFLVQKDQLLLLQTHEFPVDTTVIDIYANGSGLAILNVNWNYNTMKEPMIMTDKKIKGSVVSNKIGDYLYLVKACISTDDTDMGMSITEFDVPSGYNLMNLYELKRGNVRVDYVDERAVVYYNEIDSTQQCADFKIEKDLDMRVNNVQPAAVRYQSYYNSDVRQETLYTVEDVIELVDECTVCEPGVSCPERCPTSKAPSSFSGALLSTCIALLVGLIVAL